MAEFDDLMAQAQAAAQSGNRLVARGYWRRAARLAPDRIDIWQSLLQVTDAPTDRKRCLEAIVRLDPAQVEAQTELEQMIQAEQTVAQQAAAEQAVQPEEPQPAVEPPLFRRADVTDAMRLQWDRDVAEGKTLYCLNHPKRETTLRCNSCGAPICSRCASRTPVGFRCRTCILTQQAVFYNSQWYDYVVAILISLVLGTPAALVAALAGWWFALIISPLAGGVIGGLAFRAIGRRRGRWTWLVVGICVLVGALIAWALVPHALVTLAIYAAMSTSAAAGVLRWSKSK